MACLRVQVSMKRGIQMIKMTKATYCAVAALLLTARFSGGAYCRAPQTEAGTLGEEENAAALAVKPELYGGEESRSTSLAGGPGVWREDEPATSG